MMYRTYPKGVLKEALKIKVQLNVILKFLLTVTSVS